MEQIRTIQTPNGKLLKGRLLKQRTVVSQEKTYSLSEYDIEDYGEAFYAENPLYSAGGFRKARSMMPFEYLDKTANDFKWDVYDEKIPEENKNIANAFIINFLKFQKSGKGLYIYSGTRGSGKTLLSCCLLNEVINRYDISAKFISILDYLELTKKGYSSIADKEEKDSIMRTSVLVLDDIGVEVSKDWINTTLYHLINFRYSNKLITIITSNASIEDLKVDGRIKDRVNAMCIPLHMPEVSIRTKQARQDNIEFLKSVM